LNVTSPQRLDKLETGYFFITVTAEVRSLLSEAAIQSLSVAQNSRHWRHSQVVGEGHAQDIGRRAVAERYATPALSQICCHGWRAVDDG